MCQKHVLCRFRLDIVTKRKRGLQYTNPVPSPIQHIIRYEWKRKKESKWSSWHIPDAINVYRTYYLSGEEQWGVELKKHSNKTKEDGGAILDLFMGCDWSSGKVGTQFCSRRWLFCLSWYRVVDLGVLTRLLKVGGFKDSFFYYPPPFPRILSDKRSCQKR